jgi:uridine phosphorylase
MLKSSVATAHIPNLHSKNSRNFGILKLMHMQAKNLATSELVLNDDGSVYHLRLKPENIAEKIILVGDPGRVEKVSSLFDNIDFRMSNREFITHTGHYKGQRITALSTGIGIGNIDIVVNELDALVNIDLPNRTLREKKINLNLVRVGTSGGLQEELEVGSFILSRMACGLDGLIHYYRDALSVCDAEMEKSFIMHTSWDKRRPVPYFVKSSDTLFNKMSNGVFSGITLTSPGFYGPQGRVLRLPVIDPELNDKIHSFSANGMKIMNYEMESSALFALSKLLGHEAVTICAVIANRLSKKFIRDYEPVIENLLKFTLDSICE